LGDQVAKKRGTWAELQRELARRQKLQQQNLKMEAQLARQARHEHEQAERAAKRQAAQGEKERKRLYAEDRKAEAEDMTADLDARIAELGSVLTAGIRKRPLVTFKDLKHDLAYPPFDPADYDKPLPAPGWEQFAPPPPSGIGKMFGGTARYERQETAARQAFEAEQARHAQAEAARRCELADRKTAYDQAKAERLSEASAHNAGIDDFERDVLARNPEAVAEFCTLALDSSSYPDGFEHRTRIVYRPDPREVAVEYELPPQGLIPEQRGRKYVAARDEIDAIKRPDKEIKDRYARLIAQVAIRTIHEILVSVPPDVAESVTFYGHVSTTDLATGQPIRPCLLTVTAEREVFGTFVLESLDPVVCLSKLNALISHHPYDLEPVRPVVDFESLLAQYKFVAGMDAVAGLDSRPDLLDMTPTEFEHLARQLFEAMGMKAWTTVASKDDGVDAVAINEDPVMGGHCIIQAKRYSSAVGVEPVRALAGVMDDKHATTGIMVTTSWVTKEGHAFAERHGRIRIIECDALKYLCKEHLGLDILIGLPKPPPKRR
jgi:restriction system protein